VTVDAAALAQELGVTVQGEVRFDSTYRGLYATDASNYRQVPIGVVFPRSKEDVVRAVAACRRHGAPILGRGGGTSLAGQACNAAVVLDFTRHMHRVLEVDAERGLARVEPGCVLDDLRAAAREHGLTFGPDPSTHDHCSLGGMIGNNACGVHSVQAAWHTGPRTSDNVHRLEVLTYDGARFWTGPTDDEAYGRIVAAGGRRADIHRALRMLRNEHADLIRERFPRIPRRVSGYNLDDLLPEKGFHVARSLVGSEGTCALFLEAELHLVPDPPARCLLVLGYRDVFEAADAVPEIMGHRPDGVEGMDDRLLHYNRLKGMNGTAIESLPEGDGFLLVQLKADSKEEARKRAETLVDALGSSTRGPAARVYVEDDDMERIWHLRESGLGATAFVPGLDDTWPGWEDSAVPPERLGEYLRQLRDLLDRHGYSGAFYGHFGQGLVHTRIDFDLRTRGGIDDYVRFGDEAAELVDRLGGSYSGEHGDGQARGDLVPRMFGPELAEAFVRFERIWDPDDRLNPGKAAARPHARDDNLRLGTGYDPPTPQTHFAFPDDEGSFARATLRCVGVGKCRRMEGGTMCPSYMVTRDEQHSTRGRARLLFEMMSGEEVGDVWRSQEVADALDLCLSCKGCKSDCPVSVDMATYKAEFRAHWYEHTRRPRSAYSMGGIRFWSRLGSLVPRLANWVTHTEPLASIVKWAGGVHPDREIPRLSERTFVRRFGDEHEERGGQRGQGGQRVIFWPDTFHDHFHADTAMAGARVLQRLGFDVALPPRPLCCGRPLYDFGYLTRARKHFEQILDVLRPDIEAGVPIVGIEPSCIAAFRDELPNLLPHDQDATRLSAQTFLLAEFLDRHAADRALPRLGGRALLHGHCHQKAVLDFDASRRVLERMDVEVEIPDSGCCGMAGPFGFEKDHYDVSLACAERVLLPAVRRAVDERVPVVTDGYSCREQIAQSLGVRALNLAEVVWEGFRAEAGVPDQVPTRKSAASPRFKARPWPSRDRSGRRTPSRGS
jgi:FAD/FMN-containing dehydrogenase/Fe-S oxidoreductase